MDSTKLLKIINLFPRRTYQYVRLSIKAIRIKNLPYRIPRITEWQPEKVQDQPDIASSKARKLYSKLCTSIRELESRPMILRLLATCFKK